MFNNIQQGYNYLIHQFTPTFISFSTQAQTQTPHHPTERIANCIFSQSRPAPPLSQLTFQAEPKPLPFTLSIQPYFFPQEEFGKPPPCLPPLSWENQLGKGEFGKVYDLGERVVKQSDNCVLKLGLRQEHTVGLKIQGLPHTVSMGTLYVGRSEEDKEEEDAIEEHYLLMEKAAGSPLTQIYKGTNKLNLEETSLLIRELKELSLELLQRQVAWGDVNDGNLLIEENRRNFTLIDYGGWSIQEEPRKCAKSLLIGSLEIVGWVLKSSFLRETDPKASVNAFLWPTSLFPHLDPEELPRQVSAFSAMILPGEESSANCWKVALNDLVNAQPEEKLADLLANYFTAVEEALKKHL